MFFEKRIAGNADVETADAHVNTEQEEVPMIVMSYAVVEPCWRYCIKENIQAICQ